MRRYSQLSSLLAFGGAYATTVEDLLSELSTVSTSAKASDPARSDAPRLRRVVRTQKSANSNVSPSTVSGTEQLGQSLKAMRELESKILDSDKKRRELVAKVSTDDGLGREGVAFPSAKIPMSSQELRLEGGGQEFRPAVNDVGTDTPSRGTVANATIVGVVTSPPVVLEDANGAFVEFPVTYQIPFETPMDVSITVRGYGDLFISYCLPSVSVGSTVHCWGWLMPLGEARNGVVCLTQGGNITVVK